MWSLYILTNLINDKKYVGITSQPPEKRWGANGINYKNKCPKLWAAINYYGWDNFKHEVIFSNLTKDEACKLEIEYIKNLKTQSSDFGYNILDGGNASELSDSVKQKISKAMTGNKNGLGRVCSEDTKRKISEALVGKKFSEERKRNISKAKKGKSHKPPSENTRKKISDSHDKTPVYCKELDKVFESIQQCSRELGIYATNICAVCKGRHKTTNGYHFSYFYESK